MGDGLRKSKHLGALVRDVTMIDYAAMQVIRVNCSSDGIEGIWFEVVWDEQIFRISEHSTIIFRILLFQTQ